MQEENQTNENENEENDNMRLPPFPFTVTHNERRCISSIQITNADNTAESNVIAPGAEITLLAHSGNRYIIDILDPIQKPILSLNKEDEDENS